MSAIDKVKTLHTALIDTVSGYEKAQEEAETPELKALFSDMIAMRRQHHEELHRLLVERGEAPNGDGSFMGVVHRTVIGVRAAVTGIGRDALDAFLKGEDAMVAQYDDAIDASEGDAVLLDRLRAQKAATQDRLGGMRRLATDT